MHNPPELTPEALALIHATPLDLSLSTYWANVTTPDWRKALESEGKTPEAYRLEKIRARIARDAQAVLLRDRRHGLPTTALTAAQEALSWFPYHLDTTPTDDAQWRQAFKIVTEKDVDRFRDIENTDRAAEMLKAQLNGCTLGKLNQRLAQVVYQQVACSLGYRASITLFFLLSKRAPLEEAVEDIVTIGEGPARDQFVSLAGLSTTKLSPRWADRKLPATQRWNVWGEEDRPLDLPGLVTVPALHVWISRVGYSPEATLEWVLKGFPKPASWAVDVASSAKTRTAHTTLTRKAGEIWDRIVKDARVQECQGLLAANGKRLV